MGEDRERKKKRSKSKDRSRDKESRRAAKEAKKALLDSDEERDVGRLSGGEGDMEDIELGDPQVDTSCCAPPDWAPEWAKNYEAPEWAKAMKPTKCAPKGLKMPKIKAPECPSFMPSCSLPSFAALKRFKFGFRYRGLGALIGFEPTKQWQKIAADGRKGKRQFIVAGEKNDPQGTGPNDDVGPFVDNYVSRTKYSIISFLPKNLVEQSGRAANLYFTFVALLSLSSFSPLHPITSCAPLAVVLFFTAIRAALEDLNRYTSDWQLNSYPVEKFNGTAESASGDDGTSSPRFNRSPSWSRRDDSDTESVQGSFADLTSSGLFGGDKAEEEAQFEESTWMDVSVGDIVRIKKGRMVPADCILLSSSSEKGVAYIDTSMLDGRPDLRLLHSIEGTLGYNDKVPEKYGYAAAKNIDKDFAKKGVLGAQVSCDFPDPSFQSFSAHISMATGGKREVGLSNFLPRAAVLRNTDSAIALVCYTGSDTKVVLNGDMPKTKFSKLESWLNNQLVYIFLLLAFISLIAGLSSGVWTATQAPNHWYLFLDDTETVNGRSVEVPDMFNPANPERVAFLAFFAHIIGLNVMIPISMYVTLEVVKMVLAGFVRRDPEMYYGPTDDRAIARSTNVLEDLGQIDVMMCDKTGTLTRNSLELLQCSVGGTLYGENLSSKHRAKATGPISDKEKHRLMAEAEHSSEGKVKKTASFFDSRLMPKQKWFSGATEMKTRGELENFFRMMALCHTCTVERHAETAEGKTKITSASPDDIALVAGAKEAGLQFAERGDRKMKILNLARQNLEEVYEIEGVLEFTEARKCMSVILKDTVEDRVVVYTKGADSVMFGDGSGTRILREAVKGSGEETKENATKEHLTTMANDGLRTLVFGRKVLKSSQAHELKDLYNQVLDEEHDSPKAHQCKRKMVALCETEQELMGATGLEDTLQIGVQDTISRFRRANMQLVLATGDKRETAINVAYSAGMVTDWHYVLNFTESDPHLFAKELRTIVQFVTAEEEVKIGRPWESFLEYALAFDGVSWDAFNQAVEQDADVKKAFSYLARTCSTLIAARMNARQKGEMAEFFQTKEYQHSNVSEHKIDPRHPFVKFFRPRIMGNMPKVHAVAAVGDGANDAQMLGKANVGIAIGGKTHGLQAVFAADFAIAQFRFLDKLVFVHGRWGYERCAKIINYFFYKNVLMCFTILFYSSLTAFSGQRIYDDWYNSLYNILFTSLPIFVFAVFEQDVDKERCLLTPEIYSFNRVNPSASFWNIIGWVIEGFYHSIIIITVPIHIFGDDAIFTNGHSGDLWLLGATIYTAMLFVATLRLALETNYWTIFNHIAYWGSLVLWFVFAFEFSSYEPHGESAQLDDSNSAYHLFQNLMHSSKFYYSTALGVVISLAPSVFWRYYRQIYGWNSPTSLSRQYWDHRVLHPVRLIQEADLGGTGYKITSEKAAEKGASHKECLRMLHVKKGGGQKSTLTTGFDARPLRGNLVQDIYCGFSCSSEDGNFFDRSLHKVESDLREIAEKRVENKEKKEKKKRRSSSRRSNDREEV